MKTYRFKTNINCSGCVAKVTPLLDGNSAIQDWSVDTEVPEKILTVTSNVLSPEEIKTLIASKGFESELL